MSDKEEIYIVRHPAAECGASIDAANARGDTARRMVVDRATRISFRTSQPSNGRNARESELQQKRDQPKEFSRF